VASGSADQAINVPQGGGALHGLGEKFSPDLHTGTGNFSIPITLPAGRNGRTCHHPKALSRLNAIACTR
jgi:hypothetical protein